MQHLRGARGGEHSIFGYRQFNSDDPHDLRELDGRGLSTSGTINGESPRGSPSSWNASHPPSLTRRLHIQNPDRFLSSTRDRGEEQQKSSSRSQTHLPPKPPSWMWTLITLVLGIGTDNYRVITGMCLYVLTMASGLLFGGSGLVFNIYDTLSQYSRTSVIMAVTKSILGVYWISLGIYANNLASRLFSNPRVVECIRMHSKTFLKISTATLVGCLCVTVVAINLYNNAFLLDTNTSHNTSTPLTDPNCADLGIRVVLCDIYFTSKVLFCLICLVWNFIVVGAYLSICRTHTVGIRRFMRELLNDMKIYEEFILLQHLQEKKTYAGDMEDDLDGNLDESWTIWDDDIICPDGEAEQLLDGPGSQVLRTLQDIRRYRRTTARSTSTCAGSQRISQSVDNVSDPVEGSGNVNKHDESRDVTITADVLGDSEDTTDSGYMKDGKSRMCQHKLETEKDTLSRLTNGQPPIMSNDDLMFTYFTLIRRLSASSRLLQRWISSWITFTMLWCILYVVYWINHTAHIHGIVEFLLPVFVLGLLTSAYAEVNFEGERLLKCILPTQERIPVLYYFHKIPLELKIFSFTMTYNSIVTVVAGIVITFATRIILDQVT